MRSLAKAMAESAMALRGEALEVRWSARCAFKHMFVCVLEYVCARACKFMYVRACMRARRSQKRKAFRKVLAA